jgi:hypothetical protein
MQLFVKIFQAVGAINNAFTKEGRTATQNEYFDFTAKLFNWQNKNSYSYWKNDALHSREQCMPILDTTIMMKCNGFNEQTMKQTIKPIVSKRKH